MLAQHTRFGYTCAYVRVCQFVMHFSSIVIKMQGSISLATPAGMERVKIRNNLTDYCYHRIHISFELYWIYIFPYSSIAGTHKNTGTRQNIYEHWHSSAASHCIREKWQLRIKIANARLVFAGHKRSVAIVYSRWTHNSPYIDPAAASAVRSWLYTCHGCQSSGSAPKM